MFKKSSLICLTLSLLLSACGLEKSVNARDVADKELHRTYLVKYDEGKQELTHLAQARVERSRESVRFAAPAGFFVNGKALPVQDPEAKSAPAPVPQKEEKRLTQEEIEKALRDPEVREALAEAFDDIFTNVFDSRRWGTHYYQTEKAVAMKLEYSFEYVSEKGEREITKVTMPGLTKPLMERNSYRAGDSFPVAWEGARLEANEKMEGLIRLSIGGTLESATIEAKDVPEKSGLKLDIGKHIEKVAQGKPVEMISIKFHRVRMDKTGNDLKEVASEFISKPLRLNLVAPKK